jgi:hypothetical protein
MSNSNMHPKTSSQIPEFDLTPELLKEFIEVQKQKTLNDAKEIQIKERQLEINAKYAERNLDHQVYYLSSRPAENRKTLAKAGWVVGLLLVVVMGFLTAWICLGKEQFAFKFLQGAGYIITTGLGYWLGSKNKTLKHDKPNSAINDAEVVG